MGKVVNEFTNLYTVRNGQGKNKNNHILDTSDFVFKFK